LDRIDDAQIRIDAERREILDERQVVRLEGRLVDQELDRDALAFRRQPLAVLDDITRLLEDRAGLAQQRAV